MISRIKLELLNVFRPRPRVAFLHIPKTGGTYLIQLESTKKPVLQPIKYLGHNYITEEPEEINVIYFRHDQKNMREAVILKSKLAKIPVFSIVRNMFSWLVSYYGHAGGTNPKYANTEHYDYDNASKGFEYLIKVLADRDDQWPCRKFIFAQNFASRGDLVPSWILRNHTLDSDLSNLAKNYGLIYQQKSRQRIGKHEDYRTYFTDDLVNLVFDTWKREINLYGFSFEENEEQNPTLPREITQEIKNSVYYNYLNDELMVNSKIIEK